jgi:uncharacterized protein Yka (UPF0111/DUF47 family)
MSSTADPAAEQPPTVIGRVINRVFPRTPNFFDLLGDQCHLAVEAMDAFVRFMETGDAALGLRVREIEHDADRVKDRNMDLLNKAFSTPIDREDLYRAISTIDHIINYAKTTVREMELLGVGPDAFTVEMATFLKDGAESLLAGYQVLARDPAAAEGYAQAARKAERNTEKAYRRALVELFDVESDAARLDRLDGHTGPQALTIVMDVFKRREVYRHLSDAADRVARAGEVLRDIVVKMV